MHLDNKTIKAQKESIATGNKPEISGYAKHKNYQITESVAV